MIHIHSWVLREGRGMLALELLPGVGTLLFLTNSVGRAPSAKLKRWKMQYQLWIGAVVATLQGMWVQGGMECDI